MSNIIVRVWTLGCTNNELYWICAYLRLQTVLRVPTNSSNDAVLGDLGRYPIFINAAKRCIKYWLKIIRLPRYRYVRLCYEMLVHYDNTGHINWVTHEGIIYFLWLWLCMVATVGWRWETILLKNQHSQIWHMNCNNNRKLITYKDV